MVSGFRWKRKESRAVRKESRTVKAMRLSKESREAILVVAPVLLLF